MCPLYFSVPSEFSIIRCQGHTARKLSKLITVSVLSKLNSVALVRKRTIPTERTTLVDEVTANLCG
jgi:hypothetical protein